MLSLLSSINPLKATFTETIIESLLFSNTVITLLLEISKPFAYTLLICDNNRLLSSAFNALTVIGKNLYFITQLVVFGSVTSAKLSLVTRVILSYVLSILIVKSLINTCIVLNNTFLICKIVVSKNVITLLLSLKNPPL